MSISVLLSLLLVACQGEAEPEKVEKQEEAEIEANVEENQEVKLAVNAEVNSIEYKWKTSYAFILEQYISSYGFLDLEVNPFSDYNTGVAAAKIFYEKDRDVPYLGILYSPVDVQLAIPSLLDEEVQVGEGVYLDIWDIQNGEPVRMNQVFHNHQGEAGDLAVAIVETANGETLIRYTSENEGSEYYVYDEDFYAVSNLETPVYNLANRISKSEDETSGSKFYVNDEVSENKYLEQRKQLNDKEYQWIESSMGAKSISDDIAPIIPNVLAVLESLNTQQLQESTEVLPIEEQAIFNKLLSFQLFEDQLTNKEKIEFANAIYAIKGATRSEDYTLLYYPKVAMDYYSKSNFDFILDETTFASSPVGQTPAYKDGMYTYPVLGDYGIFPEIYVLDMLKIKKVEDSLYMVQFDEYDFDTYLYSEATGLDDIDPKYFNLPKSQWPERMHAYMLNHQKKYALFKKNKYGFSMLERSSEPIENVEDNAEIDSESTTVQSPLNSQDKERYLESLSYANQLFEEMDSADSYEDALREAHDTWDDELNRIYGMLREKLPPTEMEQLKQEQRAWIKIRDAEAGNPDEKGVITHWEVRLWHTMDKTNYLIDLYFDGQ